MKQRCSFGQAGVIWAFLVASFLGIGLTVTDGLRHNYYTKHDERSLIGPIGFPFGFLETGHFNLTVFDFHLEPTDHEHKHTPHSRSLAANQDEGGDKNNPCIKSGLCLNDVLDKVKGVGFLLKKFDDEAHFNAYMQFVEEEGICIFQKFLDRGISEDDILTDDVDYYEEDDDFRFDFYDDDSLMDDIYMNLDDLYGDDFVVDNFNGDDLGYDDIFRRKRTMRRRRTEASGKQGTGEITSSVPRDGIFLDMLNTKLWRPRHAYASYNFGPGEAGFYFLMYQVCYKSDSELQNGANDKLFDIHTRFALDFDNSNKDRFGRVSYLSRGEMNLPWLFLGFSILYAGCIYIWHFNIKLINEGKQGYFDIGGDDEPPAIPGQPTASSPTIYPIHYLMGVLLTLKFACLVFESIRFHYLRVLGHARFFSAVYYIFAFIKGMSLFTVILLIGSGWSFVKPFLSKREKKMILGVLVLQVINNIAIVVLTQETEGEIAFDNWTAVLHLVDIICCCAVLMPIIWQVNQLEKNIENNQHKGKEDKKEEEEEAFINDKFEDEDDDHIPENEFEDIPTGREDESDAPIPDARMAAKLKLFRSFYILVIAYIYMTRIVVYLFAPSLNYKHTWITDFVVELTTIIFYCSIGYMFRPMVENPYLHIPKKPKKKPQVEMRMIDPSTKTALD